MITLTQKKILTIDDYSIEIEDSDAKRISSMINAITNGVLLSDRLVLQIDSDRVHIMRVFDDWYSVTIESDMRLYIEAINIKDITDLMEALKL